jgi:hypothetical protein
MKSVVKPFVAIVWIILTSLNGNSQTVTFSLSSPAPYCIGGSSLTLFGINTSSPPSTNTFSWSVLTSSCPATFTPSIGAGSQATIQIICAGTYTINHYALNGSTLLATTSTIINVFASPTLAIVSNPPAGTICAGSSVMLAVNNSGPNPYLWMPGSQTQPTIVVTPTASTCYTLTTTNPNGCTASLSTCYSLAASPPTVAVSGPSVVCQNTPQSFSVNGAASYTWSGAGITPNYTVGNPVTLNLNAGCFQVSYTSANGCIGNTNVCPIISPVFSISTASTGSFCVGSTVTLTTVGLTTHTWNNGVTTASNSVIMPSINAPMAVYSVTGTANGCTGTASLSSSSIIGTCSAVWPGDANRDGVANTSDVLELGLAAGTVGPPRTSTTNAWIGCYATLWSPGVGLTSTGWGREHSDCNGDGVINANDNTAITQNFALVHSFKETGIKVANPDIALNASQNIAIEGAWNKVDVILGSTGVPITLLYGLTFDISFDQSLIQSDSVKLLYPSSFLSANTQPIQFEKAIFSNGKLYAASVRIDHNNVSGNGKIAEFWYKVKSGLPANSTLNLSITNSQKVSAAAVFSNLTTGTVVSLSISSNAVGLGGSETLNQKLKVYPNPATQTLYLDFPGEEKILYRVFDICGREILKGDFFNSTSLDVSQFDNGMYLIHCSSGEGSSIKRIIVNH